MQNKIEKVLNKLRPYLINDGGNVEYVDFKDGICYLKFTGHCANCSMMLVTLNDGIKEALINEIPEITDVQLVGNDLEFDDNINFFDVNMDEDF